MSTWPFAVATWPFGQRAVEAAIETMLAGSSSLDGVEHGIRLVEDDPAEASVGYGGHPNSEGIVELDAAVMCGPGRRCGAVAGLRGIREAVSVARVVMERTDHSLLVGEGARRFALRNGFRASRLLTAQRRREWLQWKNTQEDIPSHDTVCVAAIDSAGNVCVGTSTSGVRYKLPGRVGDTPLIGCGFYCDNQVGAAAATGRGEDIMRYALSFRIVESMRKGAAPQEACADAVSWAVNDDPGIRNRMIAVVALDRDCRWGGGASMPGFSMAIGSAAGSHLVEVAPVR